MEAAEDKPADNSQNQAGYCAEGGENKEDNKLGGNQILFCNRHDKRVFSHFDMLSKEKVVMTIMLQSTQEVVI